MAQTQQEKSQPAKGKSRVQYEARSMVPGGSGCAGILIGTQWTGPFHATDEQIAIIRSDKFVELRVYQAPGEVVAAAAAVAVSDEVSRLRAALLESQAQIRQLTTTREDAIRDAAAAAHRESAAGLAQLAEQAKSARAEADEHRLSAEAAHAKTEEQAKAHTVEIVALHAKIDAMLEYATKPDTKSVGNTPAAVGTPAPPAAK